MREDRACRENVPTLCGAMDMGLGEFMGFIAAVIGQCEFLAGAGVGLIRAGPGRRRPGEYE